MVNIKVQNIDCDLYQSVDGTMVGGGGGEGLYFGGSLNCRMLSKRQQTLEIAPTDRPEPGRTRVGEEERRNGAVTDGGGISFRYVQLPSPPVPPSSVAVCFCLQSVRRLHTKYGMVK